MQAFGPVLFTNWNLKDIINKYILNDNSYFKHDILNVTRKNKMHKSHNTLSCECIINCSILLLCDDMYFR